MKKKKAFTVVELVFVILILSLILPLIFGVYTKMHTFKVEIDIKQQLIQQGYDIVERINVLMEDYTIDYEEYFNRKMVGCSLWGGQWDSFTWTTSSSGHCDLFTHYGNANSIKNILGDRDREHHYYYCSSSAISYSPMVLSLSDCINPSIRSPYYQSFGQYAKLFYDVKDDTDTDLSLVGDSDDEDMGEGPIAIADATGVQELYLISQDGTSRLFLRRKLLEQLDINGWWIWTGESLYAIQMLRLRWFDAGRLHSFDETDSTRNPGLYDGQIDTWACDYSQGFVGKGSGIGTAYAGYKLPQDVDDCWVDLYQWSVSTDAWNITLYPHEDPSLSRKKEEIQINPYIQLFFLNRIYLPSRKEKLNSSLFFNEYKITLQTLFNTKNFYTR